MDNAQLNLFTQVKESEQDFEWYPTTQAMIATVYRHIDAELSTGFSMLDIGAGDGRVFKFIDELSKPNNRRASLYEKFAIEKSQPLLKALPSDVCIVGTDFDEQTLIDKKVDTIFCNPPYSHYEEWTERILREANTQHVYLIIPQRWKDTKRLQDIIEQRKAKVKVLDSTDFLDAERSARAKVDILYVDMSGENYRSNGPTVDPFDLWFDEHFNIHVGEQTNQDEEKKKTEQKQRLDLVTGRNQVEALAELYRQELDNLLNNYKAVGTLDAEILRELGVSVDGLRTALKEKIKNLKCLYWRELFTRLDSLTRRLTASTRETMMKKLNSHTQVDFTESNAYAIIVWALKNVNIYIDQQLLEVYMRMTSAENAKTYKSNGHMEKDTWRYCRGDEFWENHHHYSLEYRLVLSGYSAIEGGDRGYSFDYNNGLHKDAHSYISDIFTIAVNLGFDINGDTGRRHWESNKSQPFYYVDNDERKLFCEIRAFKNGNIHIKANQDFMRAFNIEAARLNGWIKGPRDAAAEMGIPVAVAERFYATNLQIQTTALLAERNVA